MKTRVSVEEDYVVEYAHKLAGSDIRRDRFLLPGMGTLVQMGGTGLDERSDQAQRRAFIVITRLLMGLGRE